ncbi:AP-3 complex subunit MU-1 [Conidiobolus coronatus NRRL 28638]|uniref:AP-3 complex subunit MU-1 n=1 Tax=Conidiobolus coronatus (strain ATCC 28846 / CBS 209.66 / NRRL 28638) TaxID=796925 RepID=A0A137NXI5_CONC2|nr:AP-3 complex subunit MU-1 [Conidiobolus coronatus NRRL 28638]|eukprot:KXN67563.1 AP-3 complex subunit MU-1 [Conidiobolus coronatus NRRL 28638]
MIESLFILNNEGQFIIQKHWKKLIHPIVVENFLKNIKLDNLNELPPIQKTNQYLLVNIVRDKLVFLGVMCKEASPLAAIEFIHRIVDVFNSYLGQVNEPTIKENFVIVYQLLEEMMDYGFPLMTDVNTLKDVIAPPTIMNKVLTTVTGVSNIHNGILSGSLTDVTWRKSGIKYINNEIYFDIVEEIDAVIDNNGSVVSSEVTGVILANCRLSGMPDLTLTFVNPRIFDDYTFHPCVRHRHFEENQILSFVPPDGKFSLMNYRVNLPSNHMIPVTARLNHFPNAQGGGGKFEIIVTVTTIQNRPIEELILNIPLNSGIAIIDSNCNIGNVVLDPSNQQIIWKLDKTNLKDKIPAFKGSYTSQTSNNNHFCSGININFSINLCAISNTQVDSLTLTNEKYRPYKGVRSITKAGRYQIRI